MTERYPDDATLLSLAQDEHTGVEYIPTGRSPYYLEFRKLLQRTLLAAARANDLRLYQEDDLTIGVRPGRCLIQGAAIDFAGAQSQNVPPSTTTFYWLSSASALASGAALPADRATFVPLASVTADAASITGITDLRGEAFLMLPSLSSLGLTVDAARINEALLGSEPTVDAAALNTLTAGPASTADSEHRHLQVLQTVAGEAYFTLLNTSSNALANVALALSVPNRFLDDLALSRDGDTGLLRQTRGAESFVMLGSVHAQFRHEGDLTSSLTGKLLGVVPVDGVVVAVHLSLGANIDSSLTTDGVEAVAKVNGVTLTTTHPKITDAAGAGFRSTARGHGTASVVKTDGTQNVLRGDVLTVDLNRAAAGTITTEASNLVVLVVIRADKPE